MPTKKQMIGALKGTCGGTCLVDVSKCSCFKPLSETEKQDAFDLYGSIPTAETTVGECSHYKETERHITSNTKLIAKFLLETSY